ncbi:MAG: DUF4091 domain-containing protein [Ruminococcaceae bacterium]|nr:DUF4091 domain-containing protein [Oscillospiraceae bacterium]
MIKTALISSLEKCFPDQKTEDFARLSALSVLNNERFSVQLLHRSEPDHAGRAIVRIEGALAPFASVRNVKNIPVDIPTFPGCDDGNYLRLEPGLYPDLLQPLHYGGAVSIMKDQTQSAWIEFDLDGSVAAGKYPTAVVLVDGLGNEVARESFEVTVIGASLPEQELILTQWFHCDCLANYYRVDAWSEEHWRIVENFAATAHKNGINLLLTPIFTPALDTMVGGERTTVQLIDVCKNGDAYTFDFAKLDRWIDMCDRVGIKYFEIAHLFTQWGAAHAPKVMATVDGEYKKIFGWETCATGEEYSTFLRTFLGEFLAHMKARGDDSRCFFHISDEPNAEQLESYKAAKAVVADLLEGYPIMDALSNFEFYQQGIVPLPIPSNNHVDPFIEAGVQGLWTYYCCGQCVNVSNRLMAMPSWRNRSIGYQMYKYDIAGFLQWGYNFYNTCGSTDPLNPFVDACGEYWVPGGDTYSVYPGTDGTAWESLRIIVFHEALQDIRALKLAEQYYGKDAVVAAMEEVLGEVRFDKCAHDAKSILDMREKINGMIAAAIK